MALREILVELGIEVDDDNAEKTIENIRKGLRRMGEEGDKASKKASKGIRGFVKRMSGLQKTVITAGAAFITGKLAQGLFSFVEAASDAAEISNKLGAVFNEQTPAAEEFGKELAGRIGQSRIQIQQMTADVGALVKPLVGSEEAALDLAKSVTELSFDISSFENVSPEDALNAMRSALIGSSEPMLRFGVDTRQAALAAFAQAQGIKKSTKEMSNAEITALRLALIQERLTEKGAVGDATKTADGFANRLRALQGAFKDLKAEVGKEFLPVATEMVKAMLDFVRTAGPGLAKVASVLVFAFRAIGRVIMVVVNIIVGFAKAMTSTEGVVIALIATITGLAIAFKTVGVAATLSGIKAAAAWVIATAPVLLMILLLGIIIATLVLIVEDIFAMGEGTESVTGTMIQGFLDLVDELGSIPAAIWEMLKTALQFWLEFFGMASDEAEIFADNLITTLRESVDTVIEFWTEALTTFSAWTTDIIQTAVTFWSDTLKEIFDVAIEWWTQKIQSFIGWLTGAFDKVSGFVSGIFGGEEAPERRGGRPQRQAAGEAPRAGEERRTAPRPQSPGGPSPVGQERPPTGTREGIGIAGPGAMSMRETARSVGPAMNTLSQPGNVAGVAPTAVAAPGGGKTLINQPRTDVRVDVNASGSSSNADDIGAAVAREVDSAMERRDRQTMQAFAVQMEAS